MGFGIQGVIGPNKMIDGANVSISPRFTNDGAWVVAENHGRLYEQSIRGNVFYAGTSDAGAVLVASASAGVGALYWNKAGSTVIDEIYEIDVTMSAGNQILGSFNWYGVLGGAQISTGGIIRTLVTAGSVVSSVYGGSFNSASAKTPAFVCYVGASTWAGFAFWRVCHISCWAGAVLTTAAPAYMLYEQYEGGFLLLPGVAAQLNNSGGTTTVGVTATIIET